MSLFKSERIRKQKLKSLENFNEFKLFAASRIESSFEIELLVFPLRLVQLNILEFRKWTLFILRLMELFRSE